ncbi:hypothetical protein VNO78_07294 [Psophocarpus tetragonolobus]|uniref:Uncharacterized protein n=1 Tax=Psophocarpus tetragonolobus TaxID=3891 RepID=A0AAN9ST23_PSOTE
MLLCPTLLQILLLMPSCNTRNGPQQAMGDKCQSHGISSEVRHTNDSMPIEVWEDRDSIRKLCRAWHISLGLHSFNAKMPRKWVAMSPLYSYKGRLLTRAGDYAAADIVHKILESWSLSVNLWTSRTASPDDWEGFLHYPGCLLEDGNIWCHEAVNDPIHLPKFGNCKVSYLIDE